MKRPPLLIAPDALQATRIVLRGAVAHRVQHTLRLQPGCRVRVSDGDGTMVEAELDVFHRGEVEGAILHTDTLPPEPRPAVEIVQVLPKPALADRLIGPCTALGVAAFRFARGDRTPVDTPAAGWEDRVARWRKLASQAAEQSERGRVPTCAAYESLAACLAAAPADVRLVGEERTEAREAAHALRDGLAAAATVQTVQWIIGPEGGFSDRERQRFREWGLRPVSLGPHILRLETAAVVATSLTMYELGRLI